MSEQVAYNKCPHSLCQLFENESGEYYPVCQPQDGDKLIRGEYHPIGNQLQYPTKWGRKKASLVLLEHKIEQARINLEQATLELAKLERVRGDVEGWNEND